MLRIVAHLVNVHCIAHRLSLCTQQAAEKIQAMADFCQVLDDLADYFKLSANRSEMLRQVHDFLGSMLLKYKEYCATRWLSLYGCLDVVHRTLDALLTYFSEINIQKDPKANGLKKKVCVC
jgi:hypothetical protein